MRLVAVPHIVVEEVDLENLRTYSERIDKELSNKKPFATFNKDISHAAVITCAAFKYASNKVRLLSHRLDRVLYGPGLLNASIATFLEREGATLHILVETDIPDDHPIWNFLKNDRYGDGRLQIKRVPPELVGRYTFNYLVVDRFGYRFESDREEYAAIASFHESDSESTIKDLIDFFDRVEKESSEIRRKA